jgi:hypothetical protein
VTLCGGTQPKLPNQASYVALCGETQLTRDPQQRIMQDLGVTCRLITDTFGLHGKPAHLVPSACEKHNLKGLAINKAGRSGLDEREGCHD